MKPLPIRSMLVLAALSWVAGCSVLEEDKINYKSAVKAQALEVPPDLTQLRKDSRYLIESTSASGFTNARKLPKDSGTAPNSLGDVRFQRSGNQRWLVVQQPVDKVWDALREFWTSNGFVLTSDSASLGIMETDWTENRTKIPQDFIRRTIGKVFDGLYSSGERDRFRTRIERNAEGGVEIYVTHRGLIEEYDSPRKDHTIWMPRPADPELEIEFMRRIMIALGTPKNEAIQATQSSPPSAGKSPIGSFQNQPALLLSDELDRAWRRTGVALDRSGFTVEDRDRSKGVFFVRYVAVADQSEQEQGFFAKWFADKPKGPELTRHQIRIQPRPADGGSAVSVLTQDGQAEQAGTATKILKLLAAEWP